MNYIDLKEWSSILFILVLLFILWRNYCLKKAIVSEINLHIARSLEPINSTLSNVSFIAKALHSENELVRHFAESNKRIANLEKPVQD